MKGQGNAAAATGRALTAFELWYGRDVAPPERIALRAGSFTAYLEGADLRDVRLGGVELVRRLYFALRDENWDTIPGTLENLSVDVREDSFQITFDSHHRNRDLDFRWHGMIRGDGSTNISYTMSGTALSAFRYCRIGFCVLHPPGEYAGRPFSGRSSDGPVAGHLPTTVGPQRYEGGLYFPLFEAVSNLSVSLTSGVEAQFDFVGDLFEMEDQRNWTDGSFKTYCTPLSLGYPHTASAGQTFAQRVAISASGQSSVSVSTGDGVNLSLGQPLGRKLPQLGLGVATHDAGLSEGDKELLGALHLDHLRVDLHLSNGDAASGPGASGTGVQRTWLQSGTRALPHRQCRPGTCRFGIAYSAGGACIARPCFSRERAGYLRAVGRAGAKYDWATPSGSSVLRRNESLLRGTEPVAPEPGWTRRGCLFNQPAGACQRRALAH